MRLYRFLMPDVGNDGRDYREGRLSFKIAVGTLVGGFTEAGEVSGTWEDAGKVYRDTSHALDIAVEDGKGEAVRRALVKEWFRCFPDQLACFSAEIGEAWIDCRPE